MGAGKLDRRIVIERATQAQDAAGQPIDTWSTFVTIWASRMDMSDGERFQSNQELNTRVTRFKVRHSSDTKTVTAMDRISYEGDIYDILGVKEASEGRKRFIEITANVRNADAAS